MCDTDTDSLSLLKTANMSNVGPPYVTMHRNSSHLFNVYLD